MKKKMGRPKLPKNQARSVLLVTRVSPVEERQIKSAIKDSGEEQTAWLRNALLRMAGATA